MSIAIITDEPNSGYPRLEQQIAWYDTKSGRTQRYYKRIKFAEFVFGAAVPFMAHFSPWAISGLGVAVSFLKASSTSTNGS